MLDLGLLESRDGGWNHLPGVSGHWSGSESLSGSGELQGISKITGGRSSRGMREVEAASGGSGPTSMATSGKAVRGGVSIGSVSWRQPLCDSEITSLCGSVKYCFLFIARQGDPGK